MRTLSTTPALAAERADAPAAAPAVHLSDPDVAAALFSVWSGDPALVIASPPGAGKTRLITHLAHQLHTRAGLTVAVAAQTRAQGIDVANRLALIHPDATGVLAKTKTVRPRGLSPAVAWLNNHLDLRTYDGVLIATSARWMWTAPHRYRADVLLVDEAYQATYADLGALGALADQVVLVGDPGQIAPVVTGRTDRWRGQATGPHQPAPTALIAQHGQHVTTQRLTRTWRLGPATTALIQPLFYPDLPFTSARPHSHLALDGQVLPEVSATWATAAGGRTDPTLLTAAADRARTLLAGGTLTTDDGTRPLAPADLAVLAPHVDQVTVLAAHLADTPDVLVATANQAQGLERHAVVIVHPLAGQRQVPTFATDPGRTCVALSRHRSHLSVVTDTATADALTAARTQRRDDPALDLHTAVLDHLLDQP